MRTLYCEAGKHKWQYQGGRGRPPKNCPAHRTEKKKQLPAADEVPVNRRPDVHAKRDNPFIQKARQTERHGVGGDHDARSLPLAPGSDEESVQPTQENPFVKRAREAEARKKREDQKRMAELRQRKAEIVQEEAKKRERELEEEFETIDERVKEAYTLYDELFKQGRKSDEDGIWRKIQSAQNNCINISRRKRELYAHFEGETAITISLSPITHETEAVPVVVGGGVNLDDEDAPILDT